MKKYRFSVDGISVTVFPLMTPGYDRGMILSELMEEELSVILLPDDRVDFKVEIFDKNNKEPREPCLCFAALFCFFRNVRSYPDVTLEFAYHESIVTMDISSDTEYNFSVKVGKCKNITEKEVSFPDGAEVKYRIVGDTCPCAVTVCSDSDLFDKAVLIRILELGKENGVLAALAISYSDCMRIKQVGVSYPCEVVFSAVTVLSAEGISLKNGRQPIFICDKEYYTSVGGRDLTFYPNIKYLS